MPEAPPRSASLLTAFTTAVAATYVILATLFFGGLATILGWIPPRGVLMLWLARRWARGLLLCAGARVQASFAEPLDRSQPYVLLANHQSYFDIPTLLVTAPLEVRLAAKKSLFRIPVFGWALYAGGFIPIDRDNRSTARQAFAVAAERLKAGRSVLFFPEGSRSHDGLIGRFERGGFLLALQAGVPIVPVGIRGARAVMRRGSLRIRPGEIHVAYGRPIDPKQFGVRRRTELMAEVRRQIAELAQVEDAGEPADETAVSAAAGNR